MQGVKPLPGADAVNDGELEVGFDERFELRFHWAEIAGRVVLFAVVGGALLGLFGREPFSHATASDPDHSLAVDYEPVARYGTPTQVTLHLHSDLHQPTAEIAIGTEFVEPLGLQDIEPQPLKAIADGRGERVTVALTPGHQDTLVRLDLKPSAVGPVAMAVAIDGRPPLRWTQVIMP